MKSKRRCGRGGSSEKAGVASNKDRIKMHFRTIDVSFRFCRTTTITRAGRLIYHSIPHASPPRVHRFVTIFGRPQETTRRAMWSTVALRTIIRSYVSIMIHDRAAQGQNRRHHAGRWPVSRSCRFHGHLRPARGPVFAVHASARGSDSTTRQPLGSNRKSDVSRRRRPRVGGATIERLNAVPPAPT